MAGLRAQPPPGKQRQLVPAPRWGAGEVDELPDPRCVPPDQRRAALSRRCPHAALLQVCAGHPAPRDPKTSPQVQRGRCPEPDSPLRAGGAVPAARTAVGGRRPSGNFITIIVITTFYCFSPRRGCSQRSVARACLPKELPLGEDPRKSCFPGAYLQPSPGARAAWMRRTQPRSR